MTLPLVLAIVGVALAAALIGICYWGAGIILFPPDKEKLVVFPERFGLRYEKVSFKTKDGLTLKGWFIPSITGEKRTLLMCHGWGDNKGYLLDRTHYLASNAGFNLLYFDYRSHGESEGNCTTIGYWETRDNEAAIQYLKDSRPGCLEKFGIFGMSMGGAVGIMTMAVHPEVKAAVIESSFTNFREVVRQWAWTEMRVPNFPLVILTLIMLRLRIGDPQVDKYHPINFIPQIAPRPLFLIGGEKDALMPEEDVRALYDKAGQPKQLWIIPGAVHGKCHVAAGLEYEERVTAFFRKNL